jgi:hypothetical protein
MGAIAAAKAPKEHELEQDDRDDAEYLHPARCAGIGDKSGTCGSSVARGFNGRHDRAVIAAGKPAEQTPTPMPRCTSRLSNSRRVHGTSARSAGTRPEYDPTLVMVMRQRVPVAARDKRLVDRKWGGAGDQERDRELPKRGDCRSRRPLAPGSPA